MPRPDPVSDKEKLEKPSNFIKAGSSDFIYPSSFLTPDKERKRTRILHVEDDKHILELTSTFLPRINPDFEVTSVCSAQEAFKKLQEANFDVIISDYQMPERNGLEFLKQLRQEGNSVPFVIFTGKGREEVAMQALNLGAHYYLMKEQIRGRYW
ncbi:MAG: response regulator [Candidatus Heimdallarchaeota archaeon]